MTGTSCEPATERVSPHITRLPDGTCTWVYEMSLFKNPTVFLLVWKIFFFILLGVFALIVLLSADGSRFWWEGFWDTAKVFGYLVVGMTALTALGYLLYAAIMGGKYIVEFEMNEQGVVHRQIASQAKKAKRLARATMLAGAASGRLTAVGAGVGAQRTEMISAFSKVKKVKVYPRRHLIKLRETLEHNQVYALPEDFDFVRDFILAHCPHVT
ncbi:MAG: hypothetical protein IKI63_04480 [Clostridia bacterium]|nr:hypothetical protein [Clostridia bacterium]